MRLEMPTWQKTAPAKFAQHYNVSVETPPPDVNVPVHTASEHLARVIRVLPSHEVTEAYMRETGFRFPTLVPDGLVKLAAPPETFTAEFVAAQIGTEIVLEWVPFKVRISVQASRSVSTNLAVTGSHA